MMAHNAHSGYKYKVTRNQFYTLIIIIILLILGLHNFTLFSPDLIPVVSAESGAPPVNGSTSDTWFVDSGDFINRSNENIGTLDIVLNNSGKMVWKNVTAEINGEVDIKSGGIFNLTDCNLTLSGNLSVHGFLNLINTTILINCTSIGQYFVSVDREGSADGGTLNVTNGSKLTGPALDRRVRVLWVDKYSNFTAINSTFEYIGAPNYNGILIESSNVMLQNSTFSYIYPSVILSGTVGVIIINCLFNISPIGLNLSYADNNIIRNSTFQYNEFGLIGDHANTNNIIDSKFLDNNVSGVKLHSGSNNNTIIGSIFFNNYDSGLIFQNNSKNNNVTFCNFQNSGFSGILCNNNSDSIRITNSSFDNNLYGIRCENQSDEIDIINSTFLNSIMDNFFISGSSAARTLNTSFDNNKVNIENGSNFTVQWFLHIFTLNSTMVPLPNVNLSIADNDNGSYDLITFSNNSGIVRWLVITEYYEIGSNRTYLTPYTIRARKKGHATNVTIINISSSKIITLILNRTIPPLPDLTPTSISYSTNFPRRTQLITITAPITNVGIIDFNNNITNVSVIVYVDNIVINVTYNLSSISVDKTLQLIVPWRVNVSNGTHTITVDVDVHGNLTELNKTNNSISREIIINSLPVAILKVSPNQTLTYNDILFDANDSYNEISLVGIQSYFYDFGDGTILGWVTNTTVYHNYSDDGVYLAKVKVRDISFAESNWSLAREIIILNRPPVANFTIAPPDGTVETEFVFDPSLASDQDGVVTGYFWEFSDGASFTNHTVTHTFLDDIEYSISLIVTDDDGNASVAFIRSLMLQNLPPIAIFEFSPVNPNSTEDIIFNGTFSTDPDDDMTVFEYTWDFDDGTFEYNQSVIQHNYSNPGVYNVTLYVKDDDGAVGEYSLSIIVNETSTVGPNGTDDDGDIMWAVVIVAAILIIFVILILLVFITQSRKLQRQLSTLDGGAEFKTAGKLDFVIVKKPVGKRFMKFELHRTTKSPNEFLGLIWKSAFFDNSWQLQEIELGPKDKVIDYLQLKVLAYNGKNWSVDYNGNGMILSKPKPALPPSELQNGESETAPTVVLDQQTTEQPPVETPDTEDNDDVDY
jgi:PKD repeat protein